MNYDILNWLRSWPIFDDHMSGLKQNYVKKWVIFDKNTFRYLCSYFQDSFLWDGTPSGSQVAGAR